MSRQVRLSEPSKDLRSSRQHRAERTSAQAAFDRATARIAPATQTHTQPHYQAEIQARGRTAILDLDACLALPRRVQPLSFQSSSCLGSASIADTMCVDVKQP